MIRPTAAILSGILLAVSAPSPAQTSVPSSATTDLVSPLPPPATRASLRGRWFELLSALNESDEAGVKIALDDLLETADRVGIQRLSDFSRAALYEARRAADVGNSRRREIALDTAIRLDPELFDARWEKFREMLLAHRYGPAGKEFVASVSAIFAAHESRREFLSNGILVASGALAATVAAFILILLIRHLRRILHDLREIAGGILGRRRGATPLAVFLLGLPLWFTLGPGWLLLYWAVVVFVYAERRERIFVAVLLLLLGLVEPVTKVVADENLIARSPIVSAAIDLEEHKEDGASVELLHQAAQVFPEDSSIWYLLGRFAQRRLDYDEAAADYGRAIRNDSTNFRAMIAVGNIHFWQGDLPQAIQDYRDAVNLRPYSALAYYNLSLAQGDAYLFDQQRASIARARQLSPREVDHWIESPTLSRVLARPYSVEEAEALTRKWSRESKSQLLPGMSHGLSAADLFLGPESLGPWGALVAALVIGGILVRRGFGAEECARCGRGVCGRCRVRGVPLLLCPACAEISANREAVDPAIQAARSEETRRKQKLRRRERRLIALLLPGARGITQGRPGTGLLVLFLFFLLVAAGWLGGRLFPVVSLPAGSLIPVRDVVASGLAFFMWLIADFRTLRS